MQQYFYAIPSFFQAYFISDFFTQVKRKPDDITLQNIRESATPTNYNTVTNPNNDGGTVA